MLGEYFSTEYWLYAIITITAICFVSNVSQSSDRVVYGSHSSSWGWILVILSIIYIGLRPLHMYGDSWLYSTMFRLVQTGVWQTLDTAESEWLWNDIEFFFIHYSTCQMWYLFIAFVYIFFMAWAIKRWIPENFTTAIIFAFTAMSFHAYATNGIRNGMATSIMMLGMSFLFTEKRRYLPAIICAIAGSAIHSSIAVVAVGAFLALYFNNAKTNTYIWIFCVLISLVGSDFIVNLLTNIMGSDRMAYYSGLTENVYQSKGLRYDFILFSSVPIILGWIVCVKNELRDGGYEYILATYTIVNGGWVLINTIAFSKRFAYLSWFLYPIILSYPFLKFRFMDYQSRMIGILLLFNIATIMCLT